MRRFIIAIGLLVIIVLLHQAYPYALEDENTRLRALYLVMLLVFLLGGGRMLKRPITRLLRDAVIWLAVLLLLVLAYSFRDELSRSRLMAELMPSQAQISGDGTVSIHASEGGHFLVEGEVNGAAVRFMIDTGASDIVLTPGDARRAGFDPDMLDYTRFYTTANGGGTGATVTLGSLQIGNIALSHIPASVNKVWMPESLLGMSFLRRLRGFRVEGSTLVLTP